MHKRPFIKRFFVLLMVLCMTASYMPTLAFAADESAGELQASSPAAAAEQVESEPSASEPAPAAEEAAPAEEAKEESKNAAEEEASAPAKAEEETPAADTSRKEEAKEEVKEAAPASESKNAEPEKAADAEKPSEETAPAEEATPAEETAPAEEAAPEEEALPEEEEEVEGGELFEPTKNDYLSYDPFYIEKYANPAYVNIESMSMDQFVNVVTAAKGIATYNVLKQSDFEATEKNFIGGMSYEMPVYNIDDNSQYYVAIPNVNKFNSNFKAYDLMLAYNNDMAETISGWKYDNGILYIPKTAVDNPKNKYDTPTGALLAVQLNYAIGTGTDFSKSIPVQILNDSEPKCKTVKAKNIFDVDGLTVSTGVKGRKARDISVFLNGTLIPINSDAWTYNKSNGKITIKAMPGVVSNINVVFQSQTVIDKAEDRISNAIETAAAPFTAYAATPSGMVIFQNEDGQEVTLKVDTSKMFVGWRGHYYSEVKHTPAKIETFENLPGWTNSVSYLYGGYTSMSGSDMSSSTNKEIDAGLAPLWAISSFAVGGDLGLATNTSNIQFDTPVEHYVTKSTTETHTMYEWLMKYRDSLEKSKLVYANVREDGTVNPNGGVGNGIGGANNFAIHFPSAVSGSVKSLAADGRANEDFVFESDQIDSSYWFCAGCSELDDAAASDSDSDIYVTCLAMDTSQKYIVFAFSQARSGQNATAIYKFRMEETAGYLTLEKASASPSITSANSDIYSLSGAVYGVYTDAACTAAATDADGNAAELTTDASGKANVLKMQQGTYYIKEKTASAGFELDEHVYTVSVTSANTAAAPAVANSTENPKWGYLTVEKASANPNITSTLPSIYSLSGAVYGVYTDAACTAAAKDASGNTAVLTTTANGKANVLKMPPRTYYIKEKTASAGFELDEHVYTVNATPTTTASAPAVAKSTEKPKWAYVKLKKEPVKTYWDVIKECPDAYSLQGAVYYLYTDAACTQRAKTVAGAEAVLTTTASGETNTLEMVPGTYYAKEITPSKGFFLDENVNGGKSFTLTLNHTKTAPYVATSKEEPKRAHVSLTKKAAETDTDFLAEAPNNYTLEGAVYKIYTDEDCTKEALDFNGKPAVLTTKADGTTNTLEMLPKTYYVKEVTAPKGYLKDKVPKPAVLNLSHTEDNPYIVNATDEPTYAIFNVLLNKESEKYGYQRLIGAEYTLKYYDVDPDKTDVSGDTPVKTWVFKISKTTKVDGRTVARIDFNNDEPISGGQMYKENGNSIMPIGVFTLKETKAPKGLAIDPNTYMGNVKQPANGEAAVAAIEGNDTLFVSYKDRFELINAETKRSVKLIINKKDADTKEAVAQGQASEERKASFGSLAGAKYEVYMEDSELLENAKVGEIVTDENGYGELRKDEHNDDEPLDPGKYYIKEVQASPGYVVDSMTTENEEDVYKDGQHIVFARVDAESETIVFEYTTESLEAPHHTIIHKTDITDGSELPGALLQVINEDGEVVEEWTSTEEPHDIVALPDGKYTLREITAPYGYDVAEDVEFEVVADKITNEVHMDNKPITIGTTATDAETNSHAGSYSTEETVKDEVRVTGLYAGRQYKITGTMMDKATGEAMKNADGEDITAEKEFTADAEEMTIELEFKVDSSQFTKETTTVAFEKLYRTEQVHDVEADVVPIELQKHEDIDDEDQTIHYGGIASTTAVDKNSGSHNVLAGENAVIIDTVEYKNLSPKNEYTLTGELFDKTTGELTGITAFAQFKPEKSDGTVDVEFRFDASKLEGHTMVVYEHLAVIANIDGEEKPVDIDSHEDPDDEDQTIHIPKIRTTATGKETKEHIVMAKKDVVIKDVVKYENLIPGKEYTVKGKLVYKDNGNDVIDDGKSVTAETKFTPEEYDGEVTLEFKFNAVPLAGKKTVAFEEVYEEEYLVGVHADIKDKEQTVYIPKIGTTAIDSKTKDHVAAPDEEITVTDTVKYENLVPGKEYTMKGTLMQKSSGKALQYNGKDVTAETKFTPEKENGEVVLEFKCSGAALQGDALVAFEECYFDGVLVAAHTDIEDEDQSVHVPEIRTTAVDSETKEHISNGDDKVTIIDTVQYKSLAPGKEYTVVGILMDKTTGQTVQVNGQNVTAQTTFKAEKADGSVDVTFTFDATALKGTKIVAYEYAYYKDVLVAVHANINDEDQTVTIPNIGTKIGTKSGKKVIDTVSFTGLIPGKTYVMDGYFVSKKTGDKVSGSDGTVTFTPETPDGTIDVELTPGDKAGKYVAFESCYIKTEGGDKALVGEHKDIEDLAQTYTVTSKPKTGDNYAGFILGGAFILSAALYLIMRKRAALKK